MPVLNSPLSRLWPGFCFGFLSGRDGATLQLRPVSLEPSLHRGAFSHSSWAFGGRGAGSCIVRVASRPRLFFWRLCLTWGRLAALAALCGGLRVLPCRGVFGVLLALLRAFFGAVLCIARPLPRMCFRLPVRLLVQHTLEDLVGPVQLGHRQEHIDHLPPVIPVPDGGKQQLLLLGVPSQGQLRILRIGRCCEGSTCQFLYALFVVLMFPTTPMSV